MIFRRVGEPLTLDEVPTPEPEIGEVLIKVKACGVCRTDLHIVDGDLRGPKLPLILGHQIVGIVEKLGSNVTKFKKRDRVGVPWLGGCCEKCRYCKEGLENLCNYPTFTGYLKNGGYAEYAVAFADFCFPLPESFSDIQAAPLLCAGLIGYRCYRMTGKAKKVGLYGFGSSAHIIAQLAIYQGKEIYAFTRPGDSETQAFAKKIGATWVGGSDRILENELDAVIIFAPVGELIPKALKCLSRGGKVVCAGIHMSDIPSFPYEMLWNERSIKSVANLTRKDGEEFLALAPEVPIRAEITVMPLEKANEAIDAIRSGEVAGSIVLQI